MSKPIRLIEIIIATAMLSFSVSLQAKKYDAITYEQTLEVKKGSTIEYTSASGEKFSVGQEIYLGTPANGHQIFTYAFLRVGLRQQPFQIWSAWTGSRLKIDKIFWKQVQGQPTVSVNTSMKDAGFGAKKQLIGNLEAAIESGEVATSKESKIPVPEKSPIEKLKEAKELLDLEVITQDEYDEIKERLTPLILGK